MPTTTLAGHPLHPILIVFPAGLVPFSFVMDLMHIGTGDPGYGQAGTYCTWGALLSGALAGTAGALDYLAIPRDSEAKTVGTVHGMMNLSLMALLAGSLLYRRRQHGKPRLALNSLFSGIGTAAVIVSSWYGGHLVYEHGIRVRKSRELPAREAKLPGDDAIAHTLEQLPDKLQASGR